MKFTYRSPVYFDELDPLQMLHNSRFLTHVERATVAWYREGGGRWELDHSKNPDQVHVVREFRIEFLAPVVGPGDLHIELWVEHLGNTSCVYGFRCTNPEGAEYARGKRTIVKLDHRTRKPAPWTNGFREHHARLINAPA